MAPSRLLEDGGLRDQARIHPLRLATLQLPDFHPEAPGTDTVHGFAVCADGRCVLVDTGVGVGSSVIDRLYAPARVDLADALERVGLSPRDVTAVVNTHLHFDHCGGNRLFPGVPIFVQQAELDAVREPHYTVREWVDFEGASYVPVQGTHAISDTLTLLPTPGHTPGHQSLVVRSNHGIEIVVGQAVYSAREYQAFFDRRSGGARSTLMRFLEANATWSADAYLASIDALQQAGADRAYFSHDATVWERGA